MREYEQSHLNRNERGMPDYNNGQYLAPSKEALAHAVMDPSSWVSIFGKTPELRGPRNLPRYVVAITSLTRTSAKRPSKFSSYDVTGEDALGRTFKGSVSYEEGRTPMYGHVMVIKWDEEPVATGADEAKHSDVRGAKEFVGGMPIT